MLTEIRFYQQVILAARKTIVCSPEMESRVKTTVDMFGLRGVIAVVVLPSVPDDRIFVLPYRDDR
jgi:hypothetical protein